ncbi:ATP-binding protein, partial [Clostridium sp.]|uniref:ATP-binding protein n=1 Tax=Clostridium sp. TaxID=1506 RepID=UPI0026323218
MEINNVYDESQIQVLEGLEAVRKRPGMYIGSTSIRGLHHLVYEIVDNSIDEALAGFCKNINVIIHQDNSITVIDDGRGMPVGIHHKMKIPTVEVIMTVLHAGGKFGGGAYKVSGGLHGVGSSVVNALSVVCEVEVKKDGHIWKQTFAKGKTTSTLVDIGTTTEHGTKVFFTPDPEIFEEINFDFETLSQRLRELAFLNKGLRITLTDERDGKNHEFLYEGGIKSFVDYLNRNKGTIHETIYMEGSKDDYVVEIALQYNDTYTENIFSFANNIDTVEGGTHLVGFKTALTRVVNDYAKKFGFLKDNDKNLSGEDVREGLTAVISIK